MTLPGQLIQKALTLDTDAKGIEGQADATTGDDDSPADLVYDVDGEQVSLEPFRGGHQATDASDYAKRPDLIVDRRFELTAAGWQFKASESRHSARHGTDHWPET